jgi:hypothetical protein
VSIGASELSRYAKGLGGFAAFVAQPYSFPPRGDGLQVTHADVRSTQGRASALFGQLNSPPDANQRASI